MTTHLTDTQKQTIRIALARYMGALVWKRDWDGKSFLTFETMAGLKGWKVVDEPPTNLNSDIPNYPADLNACHAIEVKLTDEEHEAFRYILRKITDTLFDLRAIVSASAEHRSLALFRALNLGELGD